MKLNEDFDDEYDDPLTFNSGHKSAMGTAAVVAVLFILLAVAIVVMANQSAKTPGRNGASGAKATPGAAADWNPDPNATSLISGKTGTASDLDFWDAYPTKGQPTLAPSSNQAPTPTPWGGSAEEDETEEEKPSVSEDGLHTRIVNEDGTEEWVELNPYLSRNSYQASGFVYQKPFMSYYENNTQKGFVGVDISKEEGDVDFVALKNAGVDFVMLRLGQRGYTTGDLSMDERFVENYNKAREAGLDVGMYFVTAAVNIDEAKEEADFCIQVLTEYDMRLNYPLALSTEKLGSGKARMDELEKMPRTNNAITFMKAIENSGIFSMLYGDKTTLIKKYSLGSMIGYDVWYSGDEDIPDYPYQYVMWQYDKGAKIDGIQGGAHLNICFLDYTIR